MGPQGKMKMVEVTFDLQTLQLEDSIKDDKDMVVLGGYTVHKRFP